MKHVLFILLLAVVPQIITAQELKTYKGLYKGGQATYTYYEAESGERIYHGPFNWTNTQKTLTVNGRYRNDKKEGQWVYQEKYPQLILRQTANYRNGQMEGKLIMEKTTNRLGKVNREVQSYEVRHNRVVNWHIDLTENSNVHIVGQTDSLGYPDGKWKRTTKNSDDILTDVEIYRHGLLMSRVTINESTGEVVKGWDYKKYYDVDPDKFLAAYSEDKGYAHVDGNFYGYAEDVHKSYSTDNEPIVLSISNYIVNRVYNQYEQGLNDPDKFGHGEIKLSGIPLRDIKDVKNALYEIPVSEDTSGRVYEKVELMPMFPGGTAALMRFLASNVKYPIKAQENGIQGRVVVSFIVGTDGSLHDIRVEKSVHPVLDAEALRVVSNMPKWIPGRNDGVAVNVKSTVPIAFRVH